jgi:hypothetical protein
MGNGTGWVDTNAAVIKIDGTDFVGYDEIRIFLFVPEVIQSMCDVREEAPPVIVVNGWAKKSWAKPVNGNFLYLTDP